MGVQDVYLKQMLLGQMMNYIYLVGDPATKQAAVIDAGWESQKIRDAASSAGFTITHILLTHTHFDHANDVRVLSDLVGAKIVVHESEARALQDIPNVVTVKDGDHVQVGNLDFEVLHTPGHTPGSICFKTGDLLFAGDTLFIGAIGRTDLEGGDSEKMFQSLARLRELPDKTMVYPGHEYGPAPASTIGEQKQSNPYLRCTSVSDFLRIA